MCNLNETLAAKSNGIYLERPKWDQKSEIYTPKRDWYSCLFHVGSSPAPPDGYAQLLYWNQCYVMLNNSLEFLSAFHSREANLIKSQDNISSCMVSL